MWVADRCTSRSSWLHCCCWRRLANHTRLTGHWPPEIATIIFTCEHRRRSGWNSGGTHGEGRRWIGAECGRVCGGVSPLQPARGSGVASWAPPAGSGAEPRPKTDFGIFWMSQNAHFCTLCDKIYGGQFALSSPLLQILGGTCPPCPPVIYAHGLQSKQFWAQS